MMQEKSKKFMNQNKADIMKSTEDILTKTGTVVFLETKKGSKSEGSYPHLYESAGNCVRIMMKEDNPFENAELLPYDGKRVVVRGIMSQGNIFIINSIEKEANKN